MLLISISIFFFFFLLLGNNHISRHIVLVIYTNIETYIGNKVSKVQIVTVAGRFYLSPRFAHLICILQAKNFTAKTYSSVEYCKSLQ